MLLKLKKQLLMEKQTGGTFYASFGPEEDEPGSEQRTAAVSMFRDEREELRHEGTQSKAATELKLLLHQEKVLPPSGLDVQGDIFFLGVFRINIKVILKDSFHDSLGSLVVKALHSICLRHLDMVPPPVILLMRTSIY